MCVCMHVYFLFYYYFLNCGAEDGKNLNIYVWNIFFHVILLHWEVVGFPGKERGWMGRPRKSFSQEGEAMEGSTAGLQSRDAHSPKGQKKGRSFGMGILSVDIL